VVVMMQEKHIKKYNLVLVASETGLPSIFSSFFFLLLAVLVASPTLDV